MFAQNYAVNESAAVIPIRCLLVMMLVLVAAAPASALGPKRDLCAVRRCLHGQIVDHTANHGRDCRIWSQALCQKRDMYVYLPPGFDPRQRYPLMFWLHGITADEWEFTEKALPKLDAMIVAGKLPPVIIAIPDGTERGRAGYLATHSGFVNTRLGRYGDYLMCDVWNFLMTHYPIRPERNAHVMAGASMGGAAAYHHAIKSRDRVGLALGIFPPLNARWLDCRGRYFGNFDPCCWGWRERVWFGHEHVGKFYGIIKIPLRRVVFPLYGRGKQAIEKISRDNPIEMIDHHNLRPGELSMFVAYGGRDEFNIDAQVESFLYRAKQRGLCVAVAYDPRGRHDTRTAQQFIAPAVNWLAPRIAPFSPPLVLEQILPPR